MSTTKDKNTGRHALTLCTQETHVSTRTVISEEDENLLCSVKTDLSFSRTCTAIFGQ